MRRAELDHILRAAGALTGHTEFWVLGSQAILASFDASELPVVASRSIEADLAAPDDIDGAIADDIDGLLGEGSLFHETHGIYADGVELESARLPSGWRERAIPYTNENTGGVTGFCLELHDLCASKLLANRSKDLEFCAGLLDARLVDADVLKGRVIATDATSDELDHIAEFLNRWNVG
jgi:hypothetical protein